MSDQIFVITEDNIQSLDILYKALISTVEKISEANNKFLKKFFSSQNLMIAKFFYYELIYNKEKEKLLMDEINKLNKKLINNCNYPFVFRLLELLISTIQNLKNCPDNNIDIKYLINIVNNIVKSVYEQLKIIKVNLNNKKESKYYLREIIYLLITIHNIFTMKEKLFFENNVCDGLFYEFAQLIDKLNIIYSNICIKIDDSNGKMISELLFDSFMY
jgi:hypothetical protein